MKRILSCKNVWVKLIIVLFVIAGMQFATPSETYAINFSDAESVGGKLLSPIMSILVSLGDGAMSILQENVMGLESSMVTVGTETPLWAMILGAALGAIIAIAISIIVIASGAALAAAFGIIASTTMGIGTVVATAGGAIAGAYITNELLSDEIDLPLFSYSAEEIFQNHILLFNVDFFNTDSREIYVECAIKDRVLYASYAKDPVNSGLDEIRSEEQVDTYFDPLPTTYNDTGITWYVGAGRLVIL